MEKKQKLYLDYLKENERETYDNFVMEYVNNEIIENNTNNASTSSSPSPSSSSPSSSTSPPSSPSSSSSSSSSLSCTTTTTSTSFKNSILKNDFYLGKAKQNELIRLSLQTEKSIFFFLFVFINVLNRSAFSV
jgi:hypothetical protein